MTPEKQGDDRSTIGRTMVLYDGVCGLCNRFVTFLLRRDQDDHFRFAPLQCELAHDLLRKHALHPDDPETLVAIAEFGRPTEHALTRSSAVLFLMNELGGAWRLFQAVRLVSPSFLECSYRFIARRRYGIFSRLSECPLPRPEDRHKFIW